MFNKNAEIQSLNDQLIILFFNKFFNIVVYSVNYQIHVTDEIVEKYGL